MPHALTNPYTLCCAVHSNDRHAVAALLSTGAEHALISPSREHIVETTIRLKYPGMLSDLLRDKHIAASLPPDILYHLLNNATLYCREFAVRMFFKRGFFALLTDAHRNDLICNGMSHLSLARPFIDSGVDINCRFGDGSTPLISAVKYSSCDAALFLLSRGADPNIADDTGRTALVWAVGGKESHGKYQFVRSFHEMQLIRALKDHGATAITTSYDPVTNALLDIVCSDDPECNEKALTLLLASEDPYLMQYLCSLLGTLNKRELFIRLCKTHPFDKTDHVSAYMSAAQNGNHEFADTVLDLVVRHGCSQDDLMQFAFIAAAQTDLRYIERLKTLITQPWSSSWFLYKSLLVTACKDGNERMFDMILDNDNSDPLLMAYCLCCAIRSGNSALIDRLTALIPAGFDHSKIFDPVNEYSGTPLIAAAQKDDRALVERLIRDGAPVNGYSDFHSTPLAEAINDGNCAMVRLLIGYGATWNKHMNYIVHIQFMNPPMCALLLETGILTVNALVKDLTRSLSSPSGYDETLIAFLLHSGWWQQADIKVRGLYSIKAKKCGRTALLELIESFKN